MMKNVDVMVVPEKRLPLMLHMLRNWDIKTSSMGTHCSTTVYSKGLTEYHVDFEYGNPLPMYAEMHTVKCEETLTASEQLIKLELELYCAYRELHKWLNEEQTKDIDRVALATLLWHSRVLIHDDV